jgi:hypothetical protein
MTDHGPPRGEKLFRALVCAVSLLVTGVVGAAAWRSAAGPDLAAARMAERRAYYEKVVVPSGVVPRDSLFWEAVK